MSTRLVFLDFSSLARPIWEAPSTNADTDHKSQQMVARVRALASGQPHFVICCDSGRSFRKDLDPTYKAQRPEVDASYKHQVALALETLTADGFPVWAVPGMEADDVIASAVQWSLGAVNGGQDTACIIASSDKDLFQLIGPRVSVHRLADTKKSIHVDEFAFKSEFGIEPNQMRDYLCLVGDASDNIKGADGIGPKKAAAMLQKYGNLEDLYAALDKHGTQFTPSTATALREFQPRMAAVRALVSLKTDVVLPFEEVFRERVAADVATFGMEDSMEGSDAVSGSAEGRTEGKPPAEARQDPPTDAPARNGHSDSHGNGERDIRPVVANAGVASRAEQSSGQPAQQQGLATYEPEVLPPPSLDPQWQLEPRSIDQAITLAKHMHASKLFSAYGTPQAVLATIMAGRELGMQTQKALRAFHIIDGKPSESADLIRAQCLVSPMCEYFRIVERSPTKATWVTKRKGDPEVSLTYTIEEGRQAWQKDEKAWLASAWTKRPTNMVTKTASSTLARLIYPDVVGGLYCPEELTGEERE